MGIVFAFGSAFFAGITAILVKCGMKQMDSNLATAVRTTVVLAFSWFLALLNQSAFHLTALTGRTLVFLILSGMATGASWLCYFKALHLGDVHRVAPVDKLSTVLTILLACLFLHEPVTPLKSISVFFIVMGTYLMLERGKRADTERKEKGWFVFALLSAVFAALTSILAKVGMQQVDSILGTAVRTVIVFLLAWGIVLGQGTQKQIQEIGSQNWLFLILSGLSTGASWLCYYRALQMEQASIVVPIDKLSIFITVLFSAVVLKEKITAKAWFGLFVLMGGTLLLLIE